MPRVHQLVFVVSLLALFWLAMMAVHEFGHVVHAWLSGGMVTKVVLHPLEISRTDVAPNPHREFVAWGGFVWGSLLPALVFVGVSRFLRAGEFFAAYFAGFCLIANGAYLSAGCFFPVGDTRALLSEGVSRAVMGLAGLALLTCGLYVWHRLDDSVSAGRTELPCTVKSISGVTATLIVVIIVELALS